VTRAKRPQPDPETERARAGRKAREFFEEIWARGDPWELESSEFERDRYARLLSLLRGRRYGRVLEIGCGAGAFTRQFAPLAEQILAIDVAPAAIERAQKAAPPGVEFRVANAMEFDPRAEGPWDLVVLSETVYYLGWLYSFFDVAWLASELCASTRERGRLLLANTQGVAEDLLIRPWIVRTYRDLFLNAGYLSEVEETFGGIKSGTAIEVLISLLVKGTKAT
jgi:SAM-dependent methyltransferase